jgi:peptidoglycan/xylan/chitin deacetylase (PgdA/CDA1 family)
VLVCDLVAVGCLLTGLAGLVFRARGAEAVVTVTVNGRQVTLSDRHPSVARVLKAAGVVAHDGDLFAAVSHRRLVGQGQPAQIRIDGHSHGRLSPVRSGDDIVVSPGADLPEPIESQRVEVPAPGLPEVESHVWQPGKPGIDDVEVGQRSGEVVSRRRLVDPEPASPVPGKVVALSFDDGPDPRWTPMVLQILHDEGVKAMFCIPSYAGEKFPNLVKAEFDDGHTMCDHTRHHVEHLDKKPHAEIVDEVEGGAAFLRSVTGQDPLFYRAPGGNLSPEVIDVAHHRGLRVVGWAVDSGDYRRPPAPVLLGRILAQVQPGAIILLHDGGGDRSHTVAIVKPLIDALRAQGYTFVAPR